MAPGIFDSPFNNARAPLYRPVNVCAFLNKPRLILLTQHLQLIQSFEFATH